MLKQKSDLGKFTTTNGVTITYELVRQAMNGEPYTMQLSRSDGQVVEAAVNVGIDSRLEACYCRERGDSYSWSHRLDCVVSAESLPVLLRRLYEMDDESLNPESAMLADSILQTLGISAESGKLVGREALGL